MVLPFKIKKQSLNRNSEKDSRKSVLNQTHIVGHGKPEKQISGTKNFTGTHAKPEAKIRWSSYDADSYMGRSRQGQSACLFSTKTKYKKAQWQRLFKAQEVTASGTERMRGGPSRI